MTIDVACVDCEASFELDLAEVLDDPGAFSCPNCEIKAPRRKAEAFANALDELLRSMGELASKFSVTLTAETDDLPPGYEEGGRASHRVAAVEEEEEEVEADADDAEEDEDEEEDLESEVDE